MSELKNVAMMVANTADMLIPALISDDALPSITSRTDAQNAIERVVTQSPAWESQRVWAAVFAVLTAVLAVPEVQAILGPWAPVATAAVSAALAGWSKATDPRPAR